MIINGFQRSIKILIIDHVIQCYKEQRQYDKSLYHSFFYFFVNYLAVPRATLGYFLRNNLTHDEVGYRSLANSAVGFDQGTFQICL